MRKSQYKRRITSSLIGNNELFQGKYDMKTINSLVLDFEMIVEDEEYCDKKVKIIRIFVNYWNIICYLLNIVMNKRRIRQLIIGRIKLKN